MFVNYYIESISGTPTHIVLQYGHHVVVELSKTMMNDYLGWECINGEARPTVKLSIVKETSFNICRELTRICI